MFSNIFGCNKKPNVTIPSPRSSSVEMTPSEHPRGSLKIDSNRLSGLFKNINVPPETVVLGGGKMIHANVVTFGSGRKCVLSQRIVTKEELNLEPTLVATLLAVINQNGVIVDLDKDSMKSPLDQEWTEEGVTWKRLKLTSRPDYSYSINTLTKDSVVHTVVRLSFKCPNTSIKVQPENLDVIASIDGIFKSIQDEVRFDISKKVPFIINGSGTGFAAVVAVAFELNSLFLEKKLGENSLEETIKQTRYDRSDKCLTNRSHLETVKAYNNYLLNNKPGLMLQFNSNREYFLAKRPSVSFEHSTQPPAKAVLKAVAEQNAVIIDLFNEDETEVANLLKCSIDNEGFKWEVGEGRKSESCSFLTNKIKFDDIDDTVVRIRMKKIHGTNAISPKVLHEAVDLKYLYSHVGKALNVELKNQAPFIFSSSKESYAWAAVYAFAAELFALSQKDQLSDASFDTMIKLAVNERGLDCLVNHEYYKTLIDYNQFLINLIKK